MAYRSARRPAKRLAVRCWGHPKAKKLASRKEDTRRKAAGHNSKGKRCAHPTRRNAEAAGKDPTLGAQSALGRTIIQLATACQSPSLGIERTQSTYRIMRDTHLQWTTPVAGKPAATNSEVGAATCEAQAVAPKRHLVPKAV